VIPRQKFDIPLAGGRVLELGHRPLVMGILNVTPDSFSEFQPTTARSRAVDTALRMEAEGADIIDIGGESSRPGSQPVSEEEELRRTLPVIERLAGIVNIPISVDTYRAPVAKRAMEAGAQMLNDISAFRFDDNMPRVVAETRAGVVLMHSRGSRETLHTQGRMTDPVREVREDLVAAVEGARKAGILSESIVIDPGIGFGKAADESVAVLKSLQVFSKLGYPLLVGTSRKSFIRRITAENPEALDWGTAATIVAAIMNGAHIVRVHEVRQARVLADVTDRLL